MSMSFLAGSLQPSAINTLIDTFFETKKCEMRTQIDQMLDRMFANLNTQVKELLLPSSISAAHAQSMPPKDFDLVGRKSMAAQELITGVKPSPNIICATKSFPSNLIGAEVQLTNTNMAKIVTENRNSINSSPTEELNSAYTTVVAAAIPETAEIDIEDRKKKFICDHANCAKSFPSAYGLNRHRRSHLAIKPFRCESRDCSYASANKSDTVRHMRRIHSKDAKQEQINGNQSAGDQNDNSIRRDDDTLSTTPSSSFSVQPAKQNDNYADDRHDNDNEKTTQIMEATKVEFITKVDAQKYCLMENVDPNVCKQIGF